MLAPNGTIYNFNLFVVRRSSIFNKYIYCYMSGIKKLNKRNYFRYYRINMLKL